MVSATEQVVSDYLSVLLTPPVYRSDCDEQQQVDELSSLFVNTAVPIEKQLVIVSRQLAGIHCLIAALQLLSMARYLPVSRLQQYCLNQAHLLLGSR